MKCTHKSKTYYFAKYNTVNHLNMAWTSYSATTVLPWIAWSKYSGEREQQQNLIKTGMLLQRIWAERYYRYVIVSAILKWFTVLDLVLMYFAFVFSVRVWTYSLGVRRQEGSQNYSTMIIVCLDTWHSAIRILYNSLIWRGFLIWRFWRMPINAKLKIA